MTRVTQTPSLNPSRSIPVAIARATQEVTDNGDVVQTEGAGGAAVAVAVAAAGAIAAAKKGTDDGKAGSNCIKISLWGKLILSERKGLWEVLFSLK